MRRRTFYHLSLLLPLVGLIFAIALVAITGFLEDFDSNTFSLMDLAVGTAAFFAFAGFIWFPMYIWMVVAMLAWGRGRSTAEVRRMYILSPLVLAGSMGIPVFAMSVPNSVWLVVSGFLYTNRMEYAVQYLVPNHDAEISFGIGLLWLSIALICILFGYLFVWMAVAIERALDGRGWFLEESVEMPNPL